MGTGGGYYSAICTFLTRSTDGSGNPIAAAAWLRGAAPLDQRESASELDDPVRTNAQGRTRFAVPDGTAVADVSCTIGFVAFCYPGSRCPPGQSARQIVVRECRNASLVGWCERVAVSASNAARAALGGPLGLEAGGRRSSADQCLRLLAVLRCSVRCAIVRPSVVIRTAVSSW